MFVPSFTVPTPLPMLVLYAVGVLLVFFYSTSSVNLEEQLVIPLQQFQRTHPWSPAADALSGHSDSQTSSEAVENHGRGSRNDNSSSAGENRIPQKSKTREEEEQEEEYRQYMWRQRVRALRHADYMRIETLHYLKLLAGAIPRLRSVWRGEDFCMWEGVTCMDFVYTMDTLVDPPLRRKGGGNGKVIRDLPGRRATCDDGSSSDGTKRTSRSISTIEATSSSSSFSSASDGGGTMSSTVEGMVGDEDGECYLFSPSTPSTSEPSGDLEDPIFTLVVIRLRGLQLYGRLPVVRPLGATNSISPLYSAIAATAIMEQRKSRNRREDERLWRPITSPRESQYWPWEAAEMRKLALSQNNTYEMLRYTLRRILRRLELRGLKNSHSDLQGFATAAPTSSNADAGRTTTTTTGGGGTASQSTGTSPTTGTGTAASGSNVPGIVMVMQDTLLPRATHKDVAKAVFGEIEPRLVAIQRLDISNNPGVLVAQSVEWLFPYMQNFNVMGTSPQPSPFQDSPDSGKGDNMCW